MAKTEAIQSLTPEQRRLVQENLGLVAVHLKRFVTNLATPRRDREWEDLFQEGCLGLIRAALLFRKERGIPFAAFALPRIHNAVSRALHAKFRNVRIPARRRRPEHGGEPMSDRNNPFDAPREYSLGHEGASIEPIDERQIPRCHDPVDQQAEDTVGERLRNRYECAVHRARRRLAGRSSTRGDRDELLALLERERFLVPQEESKRPLRQIARDTQSSYARVAQCDKRMTELIREFLEGDVEFVALQHRARHSPIGGEERVDPGLERQLADASADQFTKNFHRADSATRGTMLAALLGTSTGDINRLIRKQFRSALPDRRALMLERALG